MIRHITLHCSDAVANFRRPRIHSSALCRNVLLSFSEVSALVFPNHVYSPPGGVFCPRPLHVAILAQDMALAKMLLRAALETRCNGDTVFLRSHTPNTNWGEMSPVFLALLVVSTETLAEWLKLLCAAGARLNHMDWHIYRVIQCADLPEGTEEKEALKERLEFALDLLHHSGQRRRLCRKQAPPKAAPKPEPCQAWA